MCRVLSTYACVNLVTAFTLGVTSKPRGEYVLLMGSKSGGVFTLLEWVIGLLPPCLGILVVTTGGELLLRRFDLSNPLQS